MSSTREELAAERDFLLKSLDDLDEELVNGNIDPDTYRTLHDDYTARASAVIRSIDDGVDREPRVEARLAPTQRIITVVAIVAFCVLGAFLLAHAVGPRAPGQTGSGNAQAAQDGATTTNLGNSLKAAVDAGPRDYIARIAYARYLLGNQDYANAVEQYTAAADIDPKQPEPFAYRGWVSTLVALQLTDPKQQALLEQRAAADLNQAISLDAKYPDAYAFKGVMLLRLEKNPAAAVPVFQQFLVLTPPDNPMRQQVLSALNQAQSQAKP